MTANRIGAILIAIVVVVGTFYAYNSWEPPIMDTPRKEISASCEFATLGAGCFWCIESVYENVKGVERVESGYAGGHVKNPTYRQVCGAAPSYEAPVRAKVIAAISLCAWMAVITCGRLLTFYRPSACDERQAQTLLLVCEP